MAIFTKLARKCRSSKRKAEVLEAATKNAASLSELSSKSGSWKVKTQWMQGFRLKSVLMLTTYLIVKDHALVQSPEVI